MAQEYVHKVVDLENKMKGYGNQSPSWRIKLITINQTSINLQILLIMLLDIRLIE